VGIEGHPERENRRSQVNRKRQYREFVAACQAKDRPIPTHGEWLEFVRARDKMDPHEGYAKRIRAFAESLAEDLPMPLRMTIFAPPTETGLGLLVVGSDGFWDRKSGLPGMVVSELSVFGPEPKGILLRNRDRLSRTPPPVTFVDNGRFCRAGAEKDWSTDDVPGFSSALAQALIQRFGIRS
jgi:hypothetical protein